MAGWTAATCSPAFSTGRHEILVFPRLFIVVATIVGLVGLGVNFYIVAPSVMVVSELNPVARSFLGMLVHFWSFFTHLTNLGLILIYLAVLTGWRGLIWLRSPVFVGAMAGNITLVMLYYHFMLAPYLKLQGLLVQSNLLLHYVTPSLFLVWWAVFAPHGSLRYTHVPAMLAPGLLYLAAVLVRGALIDEYPYDILDPRIGGYGQVAIGAGTLALAVAAFCTLMVLVDRLLSRPRNPAPAAP